MLFQVSPGAHHALRAQEAAGQVRDLTRANLPGPVAPFLFALKVQDRSAPRLRVQLEEPFGAQARLPQDVMHVVLEPGLPREQGGELLVQLRSRQGRQGRVAGALEDAPTESGPPQQKSEARGRPRGVSTSHTGLKSGQW